jgi:spore germination protein YaaH
MSCQSLRTGVLLICALGILAVGTTPAFAAAPNRTASNSKPAATVPRASAIGAAAPRPSREVFGFALGSSLSDPTIGYPSWNFDLLTTVAYFGVHVLWNGTFENDAGLAVWNSSQLTNLVNTAHAHGTKVVLTIINGDRRGTYPNAMCDALVHTATTIKNTVAEVKAKGVDGVNVDYEGVNQACNTSDSSWARHALVTFMQDLRAGLGSSYYLSIDTYSGAAADPAGFFDVPGLNPYVDSFFVMAYDMEYSNWYRYPQSCGHFCLGPTSPLTGYHYNDTTVMDQYSAAVTAAKVILGVPYYGRKACVDGTNEYQHPVGAVTADHYLSASGEATDPSVRPGSYVAHRDAHDPAGRERWDTWYSTTLKCTRLMFWDDATSLGLKYDLANRDGLRGVGMWTLNYGGGAAELWGALASRFGGWTAGYDMTKAPNAWGVRQTKTFPVSITNTGTQTWPATGYNAVHLGVHFAKSAGGSLNQAAWLSRRTFALAGDLAPGQTATVNVTVTAPSTAGTLVVEAEMIREHSFWFQQWQPVSATVSTVVWSASYDMSKTQRAWSLRHSYTFPVTVTNTGNQTWPRAGYHRVELDLHFTTRTGGSAKVAYWLTSNTYALSADLAPGQSVTLNVTVLAPPRAGVMFLEAEMIKEHQFWFRQYAPVTVMAAPAGWSASFNVTHVPTTWAVGKSQTFSVSITNNGTQAWPSTGYTKVDLELHFATSAGGAANQARWVTNNTFKLPANVRPGQSVAVQVTVTPPSSTPLVLELEMIKEHQFWFVQYQPVSVMVA